MGYRMRGCYLKYPGNALLMQGLLPYLPIPDRPSPSILGSSPHSSGHQGISTGPRGGYSRVGTTEGHCPVCGKK